MDVEAARARHDAAEQLDVRSHGVVVHRRYATGGTTYGTDSTPGLISVSISRGEVQFQQEHNDPYTRVRVQDASAAAWLTDLVEATRRCYVADAAVESRVQATGATHREIVAACIPDPGATMSGDFGEILTYLFHAGREHPLVAVGPKKWRLKQDRNKPAPLADVVHFVLPDWPETGSSDVLLCSEVKAKATNSNFAPIRRAIEDCAKDRTSRLAQTLVWLQERALRDGLDSVSLTQLQRFVNAVDHPAYEKRFHAVAVICSSLIAGELADVPAQCPDEFELIVIEVPDLQRVYSGVFERVRDSLPSPAVVIAR